MNEVKVDDDILCRFLGILILSSKYEMSIDQAYRSKYIPIKSFLPEYKFRKILQLLSWPGYTYSKEKGVRAHMTQAPAGKRVIGNKIHI